MTYWNEVFTFEVGLGQVAADSSPAESTPSGMPSRSTPSSDRLPGPIDLAAQGGDQRLAEVVAGVGHAVSDGLLDRRQLVPRAGQER